MEALLLTVLNFPVLFNIIEFVHICNFALPVSVMRQVNPFYAVPSDLFNFYANVITPPTPRSLALPTPNVGAAHFIILDLITQKLYIDKENPTLYFA